MYWSFPSDFLPKEQIRKLKDYGFYSDVNGKFNIKGTSNKPELYGNIDLTDVWILDGLEKDVPHAIIKIAFDIIVNNIENDTKTLVLTNKLKYNTENNIEIFVYDNQYDYLLDEATYKFKLFFDIQNINDRLGYVLENSYTFNKGQTKIDITSDILTKNPGGYSDVKEDFSDYTIIRSVVNDIDGNINKPSHFISLENGRFYLIRSHLVGKEDIVNTCDIGLFESYNYKVRFNINVLNNPELNQVIEKDLHFDCTNAKGYSLKDLIGENADFKRYYF